MKNQTKTEMDKYDTLQKIVTQLESCNYENEVGKLTKNVAFLKLKEMALCPRAKILNEVLQERTRQDAKWGIQNHCPIEWMAILTEEVGEASKGALDHHFRNQSACGNEPTEDLQNRRLSRYRKECIQVAAVAVSMVECQDRLDEIIKNGTKKINTKNIVITSSSFFIATWKGKDCVSGKIIKTPKEELFGIYKTEEMNMDGTFNRVVWALTCLHTGYCFSRFPDLECALNASLLGTAYEEERRNLMKKMPPLNDIKNLHYDQ